MTKKRGDEIVRRAMALAKKLEKLKPHGKKTIIKEYKESMEAAEKLRKLLKPVWFLGREKHLKRKVGTKSRKAKKKTSKKTRKK